MTAPTIGFVGLGRMGRPMASRLLAAGFTVRVADASPEALESFLAEQPTAERLDLGGDAGLHELTMLVLMLPNSAIVEAVLDGDGDAAGVASLLAPGTLVVDMSSSEPLRTRALAARLASRRLRLIDAPVSGGVRGAVSGALACMVGGDDADITDARPVLEQLASTVIPVGAVGSGHAAKALNNLVSATSVSVTSEALRAAEGFGIAPETMTLVLNSSSGRTNTSERKVMQFMASGSFDSGFTLGLMAKDVHIGAALANAMGASTRIADAVDREWQAMAAHTTPLTDHTEVYRIVASPSPSPGPANMKGPLA